MSLRLLWWILILFAGAARAQAVTSVALMDFSTDDNSWRSMQAAAEFTSVLQVQLANVPDVEWVERNQLNQARQELELSAMEQLDGASSLRIGKWVKADWMINGQFSLDYRNRRILSLEITGLKHADVLASQTLVFPTNYTSQIEPDKQQVDFTAKTLHSLLSIARLHQQQMAKKILVAPLFFANISSSGYGFGFSTYLSTLEHGFFVALEHDAKANGKIQLIRFPKAYRSLGESEMVLDGLVEANRKTWQQIADLYVWGTYAIRQKTVIQGEPPETELEITLHLWNGSNQPTIIKKELPANTPENQIEKLIQHLADQTIAHATAQTTQTDTTTVRHRIAGSLLQAYDQMTLQPPNDRENLGLDNSEQFLQAIHILETACFFDPDNAKAYLLYITCRWGWWMDFDFKVKNEFWSKWRRSRAWGKYVNRFGLKPSAVVLPFPYNQEGIAQVYLESIADLAEMFPQWQSTNEMALEDKWQREGVYTSLMEAEAHGFPKQMPDDLAWKWEKKLQAEYWQRLTRVAEFIGDDWEPQGKMPPSLSSFALNKILNFPKAPEARMALVEKIWPKCIIVARRYGKQWVLGPGEETRIFTNLCTQAGVPEKAQNLLAELSRPPSSVTIKSGLDHSTASTARPAPSKMISAPTWLKQIQPVSAMFHLHPPSVLPQKVRPHVREFQFPEQYDVQSVKQLSFLHNKLLILAMDERSSPSTDPNAGISAELLEKRSRLWVIDPENGDLVLYLPSLFQKTINSFLLKNHRLWIAGKVTGYLNLETHDFQKFEIKDGFNIQEPKALGLAGDTIFAAGDFFKINKFDLKTEHWHELPMPPGPLSGGNDSPCLLTGNSQWLNYATDSLRSYNQITRAWTNVTDAGFVQCMAADNSGFWLGNLGGLEFYDPNHHILRKYTDPSSVPGMPYPLQGIPYDGNVLSQENLLKVAKEIEGSLTEFEMKYARVHDLKFKKGRPLDPLHLDWHIPGAITALAEDGNFLWLGCGTDLLLLNKPSNSLVAYCQVGKRGSISSLAVSPTSIWVGLAHADQLLFQISKAPFLSVPRKSWISLAISPKGREQLLRNMSTRDKAVYAFYTGDDTDVVKLLGDVDPNDASLEKMFLLAFSYEATGLDRPDLANFWFQHIISRYQNTPWAKAAQTALSKNKQNHKIKAYREFLLAKYDRNHDGILDANERRAMQKDPAYQRQEAAWNSYLLGIQIAKILHRFDRNGDGKLNRQELEFLRDQVVLFSHAPPKMLVGHNIVVAPLLSKNFPSITTIMRKYDTNHDNGLDADELKMLAQAVQKNR